MIADFERLELPGRADDLRGEDVQILLFDGRLEEGLRLADTLLERPLNQRTRHWTQTKRAQLLGALGQTDLAMELLDEIELTVTSDYPGLGELLEARVEVESWAGRPVAALAAFESHRSIPTPSRSTDIMPLLDAQWARLEVGLDPGDAVPRQPWKMFDGAPLESEGIRALHRGDHDGAARSFAEAAGFWAGFHTARELICQLGHGEALRRAGSPDGPDVLRATLAHAEALAYAPIAARARRSLRQAGVHVAPPAGDTQTQRWARMTRREREALQLVGRGLTTPQIARRMGLGRGTVDQVLASATRKLGAASRMQAAAMLADGPAGARRARRVATVRTEADAGEVVLAALGGDSLAVESGTDPALVERIQGDLRRLGRDDALALEAAGPVAALSPDGAGLLGRLVGGMSLGEAAASLHLSRRTADRRLAEARVALGVATTAEALLAYQERRRRG
jgi:DNA-binding CsgD family transcriptional regulator